MNARSDFPVLRLIVPFIAGILLCDFTADYLWIDPVITALIAITGIVLMFVFHKLILRSIRKTVLFASVFGFTLMALGYYVTSIGLQENTPSHFAYAEKPDAYIATVVSESSEKSASYRMVLKVTAVSNKGVVTESTGKIITYFRKDSLESYAIPAYGDVLVFGKRPTPPDKPGNPGEFDYAEYLKHNGIFHRLYLNNGDFKIIGHNEANPILARALSIRSRFIRLLEDNGLAGSELAVAAAILAGQDDLLDANQRQDYTGAGVIHILCVSGLHAGIIFILADALFKIFRRNRIIRLVSPFAILLIIWLYATVTGLAAPVLRASVMFTFIIAGRAFQRQSNTLNNMAAAAFLLLLFDPNLIYNIGFQLSFGAVAGIIVYQPGFRQMWFPKNPLIRYTWDLITVSLAAQIITAPLAIYHFHQFPNFFLFSNLIAIPLSGIVIYTGLLGAVTSMIPFVGKLVFEILNAEIKIMNAVVSYIEGLPWAVTDNIYMPWLFSVILAMALICLAWWISKKHKHLLFAGGMLLLILAILKLNAEIKVHNQQKIVFHKINRHPAVSFIEGHLQTLLSDSAVISDIHQVDYQLKGFCIINQIQDQHLESLTQVMACSNRNDRTIPGFYAFKSKKIVFVGKGCILPDSEKHVQADFVVISNNAKVSMHSLKQAFPGAVIVLDASNSRYTGEKFKSEAAPLAMKLYDVNENGALEVNL